MDNPRDWSSGLWLIARQLIIILLCLGVAVGFCGILWRAIITG